MTVGVGDLCMRLTETENLSGALCSEGWSWITCAQYFIIIII